MMDRIFICEVLAKRNEIDPFLKRMVTGDEKWVTYYSIMRKRSWSKFGEAAQAVVKPGLTSRKALLYLLGLERNHLLGDDSPWPNTKFRYLLSTSGGFEGSD
ncbi:mariner transposase [Trichonephila clavipes]|nr:mariner transposase [Trichonephila clavipes]